MTRHADINNLKSIKKICEAQRARAELEVGRLNLEVDRLGRQRDGEVQHLRASQAGWEKAVTGTTLQLTTSAVWSAEILRARAMVANTQDAINHCGTLRQAQCEILISASTRDDAMATLADKARRAQMRRREENAIEAYGVQAGQPRRDACE